jgi:phenylalanyl-tRNA synthetase beta chain
MPVIQIDYNELIELMGTRAKSLTRDVVLTNLRYIGGEISTAISGDEDKIDVEFSPARADLFSVEGIARALKTYLELTEDIRIYQPIYEPDVKLVVDTSVAYVRPYIVAGLIRNLRLTDKLIKDLMEFQEKLHFTVGRKRMKVAIGIHDFNQVKPPFVYKAVDPESIEFVPLGKEEYMDLNEILRKHEKGIEYAFTIEGADKYPVIVDQNEDVLSFPPIINGTLTTVSEDTKDIFLELTGLDFNALNSTLNIIVTALADRGGKLYSIDVEYPQNYSAQVHKYFELEEGKKLGYISEQFGGAIRLPSLQPKRMVLTREYINALLGTEFDLNQLARYLTRMGFGITTEGEKLIVLVPPYRHDILHQVDLVEEVAIAHGYHNFAPELPHTITFGSALKIEKQSERLRMILIGMGYNEVMTLTLSNPIDEFEKMNISDWKKENLVWIKNPVTDEHKMLRSSLMPSLLRLLRLNKHHSLPQRIFEIGDVVIDNKNMRKLALVAVHAKASFTEIKSQVEGIMVAMGMNYKLVPKEFPWYIPGRCAAVINKASGVEVGHFGEFHPIVIVAFELGYPIIGFEAFLQLF